MNPVDLFVVFVVCFTAGVGLAAYLRGKLSRIEPDVLDFYVESKALDPEKERLLRTRVEYINSHPEEFRKAAIRAGLLPGGTIVNKRTGEVVDANSVFKGNIND